MFIKKFSVKNYKSWLNSGQLEFTQGINVIVGQNNAGKTALLEAMTLRNGSKPHASLKTKPSSDYLLDNTGVFEVEFLLSAEEFKSAFLNHNIQHIYVPAKDGISAKENLSEINKILNEKINHPVTAIFHNGTLESASFSSEWYSPSNQYNIFDVDKSGQKLSFVNGGLLNPDSVGNRGIEQVIIGNITPRIFFFRAERFNLGYSAINSSGVLNSNCDNLPQVLHYLHTENPKRFKRFYDLVAKVFPNITQITIPPVGANAHIRIWFHDPDSERADLSVPIDQSGTGIGQVLAMIYILVTSDRSHVLLIDEPQSFLHPGAIRSLIEIFKMEGKHQYILTTHAPAIIGMASSVIQVSHNGLESNAKVIDSSQSLDASLILSDLGARLSDIFGADEIMWVEGATEESCFKLIIDYFRNEPFWGMQIIGVSATGDLQGKHSDKVYQIYNKLSSTTALIPPSVAFIFDSEAHTEKFKTDLIKRSKGLVHFLDRRMYENYLLIPEEIASLLNELESGREKPIDAKEIKKFICDNHKGSDPFSEKWLREVDGASLLHKTFNHFTDNRFPYEKVLYGTALTKRILHSDATRLQEIFELITEALKKKQ